VTGSAGKTGVKEAIRLCLERDRPGEVHASVKSYNNHVGVPLSLARMPQNMRYGVLEMGMNHAGELTDLSALARPDIAIITTVASAHREFFRSEEEIADAKAEIFSGLTPGGIAILNRDNPHFERLLLHAQNSPAERILSFGLDSSTADVRALSVAPFAEGTAITAQVVDEILSFKISLPGRHWALNALGVLAVVKAAGADLALAGLALAELTGLEGRGARTIVETDSGEFTLIDEAYNANPASMVAALSVLGVAQLTPRGGRIAILGDMKELGASSQEFHEALAEPIEDAGIEHLILVGDAIAPLAARLKSKCNVICVADAEAALVAAQSIIRTGDIVLVKGSNSMKLARVVAGLKQQKGA
jgi:UDP-N-acetylmuramoyl-tripeptide--D-alanyl-D-alanine ligase